LRTQKEILRKVELWKDNPMFVSGLYRLFTYLPWSKVPEEYKEFFPKEAAEMWDNDLDLYGNHEVKQDINSEIRAILQVLVKKNITHGIGLVPMILADIYANGNGITIFQGRLSKITDAYKENISYDRELGEKLATFEVIDLLKEISIKLNIDLSFDIDVVVEQLTEQFNKAEQINKEASIALALSKEDSGESDGS
jgi:hypothetical protein